MNSKFIVIEGLEGAGKTTACNTVFSELCHYGIHDIILTHEPGGTPLAEKLRTFIKQGIQNEKITDQAELLMLYAARVQLVENVIKPALARGAWVVGDRHDLSSQTYQVGGRGINKNFIFTLKKAIMGDFEPDLTLYLDVLPEIALHRIKERGGVLDRIEKESLNFFIRIRERYLALAASNNRIRIIDASQSLPIVTDLLKKNLNQWLQEQ